MEKWFIKMKKADFYEIARKFHISPILARILRNRDLVSDEEISAYLHADSMKLYDGMLLKDMDAAVRILKEKIANQKRIRVIGDYDIDGIMATYILVRGFREIGAVDVDYEIPERIRDGYGLNMRLIDEALADGIDTIVTCDNGISARGEIAYAKENGMTVIVTDHHSVPFRLTESEEKEYILPDADAVIDHQRADCTYPYKKLCGAAVAFKLMECLYRDMDIPFEIREELLEKAAFATVGDVMELDGENRAIVKQGLVVLNRTCNTGLQALIRVNDLSVKEITAYHIGFILGPCMNASGRLDTAKRALSLLMAEKESEADVLAGDLKALNDSRKDLTEQGVCRAIDIVEKNHMLKNKILVIYLPDCHESIAGIIAGRIRERFCRPTFILTKGEESVKGSGRSTENYNMIEEMMKCREVFLHFGGHRMAAGLSIEEEKISELSGRLNQNCTLNIEDFYEKVAIDMVLPFSEISEKLVEELRILEPFGMGNEKPLFAVKNARVSDMRLLGKRKNVLKMRLRDDSGVVLDALRFGDEDDLLVLQRHIQRKEFLLTAAFYPQINEFRGEKTVQIILKYVQ